MLEARWGNARSLRVKIVGSGVGRKKRSREGPPEYWVYTCLDSRRSEESQVHGTLAFLAWRYESIRRGRLKKIAEHGRSTRGTLPHRKKRGDPFGDTARRLGTRPTSLRRNLIAGGWERGRDLLSRRTRCLRNCQPRPHVKVKQNGTSAESSRQNKGKKTLRLGPPSRETTSYCLLMRRVPSFLVLKTLLRGGLALANLFEGFWLLEVIARDQKGGVDSAKQSQGPPRRMSNWASRGQWCRLGNLAEVFTKGKPVEGARCSSREFIDPVGNP